MNGLGMLAAHDLSTMKAIQHVHQWNDEKLRVHAILLPSTPRASRSRVLF